ncbi:hypothetical protein DIPPA_35736 [Diplonema papillatum]|nr:hypothetical protein DIPPA_35736 [Diplonema papillatum]
MSGSPREIRRPAQGEGLLARKREMRGTRLRPGSPPGGRGAAGSPPRGRFGSPFARGKAGGKKPAPKRKPPAADAAAQPERPAETRYSEAELLQKSAA